MGETAVSDTGPALHLCEIDEQEQLAIFDRVIVPDQVRGELSRHGVLDRVEAALGDRLVVEGVLPEEVDAQRSALSAFKVHRIDLAVAALTVRMTPSVVLTDDLELRKGLESLGHTVVGSVGILVRAFRMGRVSKDRMRDGLERLLNGSSLYLSKGFRSYVLGLLESTSGHGESPESL